MVCFSLAIFRAKSANRAQTPRVGASWRRAAGAMLFAAGLTANGATVTLANAQAADQLLDSLNQVFSQQPLIIASGQAGSVNYMTAGVLCEVVQSAMGAEAPPCLVQPTTGSAENLDALIHGDVDLALVQSDREHVTANQLAPYDQSEEAGRIRRISAMTVLPLHVVVKRALMITEVSELKGASIGMGEEGTAQRLIGRVVLSTAGVRERDLGGIIGSSPGAQAAVFCNGDLDAVILSSTAPNPVVSQLLADCDGQLLGLPQEQFGGLTSENSYLVPIEIPAETYENQREAVPSFGYVISLVGFAGRRVPLVESLSAELLRVYGSLNDRFSGIGLVPADRLFAFGGSAPLHQGTANVNDAISSDLVDLAPVDDLATVDGGN